MPTRKPISERALKAALQRLGVSELRPGQAEVVESVLAGQHTLAVMATGAGKSLCYQLPALLLPGQTVVVSPLISLMKDQAEHLDVVGVDASQLNSTLNAHEEEDALAQVREGRSDAFVFCTPERLADPEFRSMLQRSHIDLLVVDEAHCISQWGHDFRPAFLDIGAAREALGWPTVLALTATATPAVADDIARQLGLPEMRRISTGIYRGNLHFRVEHAASDDEKTGHVLRTVREAGGGAGIVFAATVKAAEALHAALLADGVAAELYHGRLPASRRVASQNAFMSGEAQVMVATNAFGMGIDKPDIRWVVHYQMPGSLEAYYQEAGRAGRDGDAARCTLLYDPRDKRIQQFFLVGRYPDADDLSAVHAALRSADAPVAPRELSERVPQVGASKVATSLQLLHRGGLAARDRGGRFRPASADPSRDDFERLAKSYRDRDDADRALLERMVFYAQSGLCRWRILLEHFGAGADPERCGHCDNCIDPPERRFTSLPAEAPHAGQRRRAGPGSRPPARRTPAPAPGLRLGDSVRLPKFGIGEVVDLAAGEVGVSFPDGSTRRFLRAYVEPLQRTVKAD